MVQKCFSAGAITVLAPTQLISETLKLSQLASVTGTGAVGRSLPSPERGGAIEVAERAERLYSGDQGWKRGVNGRLSLCGNVGRFLPCALGRGDERAVY
jgi:hypothetical protein